MHGVVDDRRRVDGEDNAGDVADVIRVACHPDRHRRHPTWPIRMNLGVLVGKVELHGSKFVAFDVAGHEVGAFPLLSAAADALRNLKHCTNRERE